MVYLLENIFGDKDWSHVRTAVAKYLTYRYRGTGTSLDDIEDAVSWAIADLLDYWVELDSSVDTTNPDRNFKWAVWRAKRSATSFLVRRFQELSSEHLGLDGLGDTHDDEGGRHARPEVYDRTAPSPEDVVIDRMERRDVSRFIGGLPSALTDQGWFADVLAGTPSRQTAAQTGITQRGVNLARQRGLARVRSAALRADL